MYEQNVCLNSHQSRTGLIFAQFPSVSTSSHTPVEGVSPSLSNSSKKIDQDTDSSNVTISAYSELGDGQIMDFLGKHIETFKTLTSEGVGSNFNIVLFRGAIEHASRICRVLVRCYALFMLRFVKCRKFLDLLFFKCL